ncbi:MAG: MbnP family protein [Crocinitomicaceae bacterium]
MKTTTILIGLLSVSALTITSCKKKGCTDPTADNFQTEAEKDDGTCEYTTEGNVTLNFTHNFGGTAVTSADFDQLNYTNANGDLLSVTKMQYLISDVRFYKTNGDSLYVSGYHLIDLDDAATLSYTLPKAIDIDNYTGIGFNYGFDIEDNVDGAYADLNVASWSSPMMLGGGYHQMKFEGRFVDGNMDTTSFQYHNLSTAREITMTDTIFHANYASIDLNKSFTLSGDANVDVQMDISEWFVNPNLWDLDSNYTMLMPNYEAQVMMTQNASTVFSLGDITE